MDLFVGHILKISCRAINQSLAFPRRLRIGGRLDNHGFVAMIVERFQVSQLTHNFACSPEHVVFQLVLFIEAEPDARLGFGKQVCDE